MSCCHVVVISVWHIIDCLSKLEDCFIGKMNYSVFIFALLSACFTTIITLTFEVTSDVVIVREGEQLSLSCSITLDSRGISEFRWYRGSVQTPYGFIDVTNCGVSPPCPEVNTIDNRGVVNYTARGVSSVAELTLVIDHSLVRDSTSFSCGALTVTGTFKTSDDLYVIVQHLPDPTYPMCLISISSTLINILSLSCWAEQTQPVVSLEWTVEGSSSDQILLPNKNEIVGDEVKSNLNFNRTGIPSSSLFFTCHMTSSAFPHTRRNCSIGPNLFLGDQTTEGILPDATTATLFAQDETPTTPTAYNVPARNGPSLNTVVIAAISSACLVVVIILLIIIACLVCSRKMRPNDAGPRAGLHLSPVNLNTTPPAYERTLGNIGQQDGDKSTIEQPPTVATLPTHYEPVQTGGGSTRHTGAHRYPGRRVQDTSAATTGDVESGYQDLEMTNQPQAEYTMLDLAIRDG